MKKLLVILLLIFVFTLSVFCATYSTPYAHYMLGYIDSATDFTATIINEVLPFDLDSTDVSFNANYDTRIKGLRIGYYSLISNTYNFALYISHTPLVLRSAPISGETNTLSQIDYRLYAVADHDGIAYMSCLSDVNANNTDSTNITNKISIYGTNTNIWKDGCNIVNQSMYVSLDDSSFIAEKGTAEASTNYVLSNLKTGTYESTIYFILMGGA